MDAKSTEQISRTSSPAPGTPTSRGSPRLSRYDLETPRRPESRRSHPRTYRFRRSRTPSPSASPIRNPLLPPEEFIPRIPPASGNSTNTEYKFGTVTEMPLVVRDRKDTTSPIDMGPSIRHPLSDVSNMQDIGSSIPVPEEPSTYEHKDLTGDMKDINIDILESDEEEEELPEPEGKFRKHMLRRLLFNPFCKCGQPHPIIDLTEETDSE